MVLLNSSWDLFCFTKPYPVFNRFLFLSNIIEFTTDKLLFTKIPQLWYCSMPLAAVY